jgi:hypothetical protein
MGCKSDLRNRRRRTANAATAEPSSHRAASALILDDIDAGVSVDGKVVGVSEGAADVVEQGVTGPECGVAEQYNGKRDEDFE